MLCLLLTVFAIFSLPANGKFVSTRAVYNGTISYDGLGVACEREFRGSKPCNMVSLLNGFWNYSLPPSWILTLENNCVGYTTAASYVMGTCVVTSFLSVTDCSCEMYNAICCVI